MTLKPSKITVLEWILLAIVTIAIMTIATIFIPSLGAASRDVAADSDRASEVSGVTP